jgi:hypothetical protein
MWLNLGGKVLVHQTLKETKNFMISWSWVLVTTFLVKNLYPTKHCQSHPHFKLLEKIYMHSHQIWWETWWNYDCGTKHGSFINPHVIHTTLFHQWYDMSKYSFTTPSWYIYPTLFTWFREKVKKCLKTNYGYVIIPYLPNMLLLTMILPTFSLFRCIPYTIP